MSSVAVAQRPSVTVKRDLIQVINGTLDGKTVSGIFEFIDCANPDGRGPQIQVRLQDSSLAWIVVGNGQARPYTLGDASLNQDVALTASTSMLTEEQVEAIIEERFAVMDSLVRSLTCTDINSVVITGAAGIGKTFGTECYLNEIEQKHGQHWGSIGGNCSPFGLYEVLYEFRNEGSILLMDDVDVFDDETKINLLKNALDTKERRVLDWRSASKALDERGIPNTFEFKGKIIFLTNTNIYAEIARQTKRAPHLAAVVSRSVTLDLGIHDVKTILIHVRNVLRKSNMLVKRGLTPYQQEQAINWLEKNRNELAILSLRTPIMIGEYMKADPKNWEATCRHTLLKPIPLQHY